MELLQAFADKMMTADAVGLSELFDTDCSFDDYCITGLFPAETHLLGKEAIDMHFFNRFIFQTYLVTGAEVKDAENAVLDVVNVGQPLKVNAHLDAVTADGKIVRITLTQA